VNLSHSLGIVGRCRIRSESVTRTKKDDSRMARASLKFACGGVFPKMKDGPEA
jgi:hypothetical protein